MYNYYNIMHVLCMRLANMVIMQQQYVHGMTLYKHTYGV